MVERNAPEKFTVASGCSFAASVGIEVIETSTAAARSIAATIKRGAEDP